MTFKNFEEIVPKLKKNNLKGFEAQKELAPEGRINELEIKEDVNTRNAGVMALVYPKGELMHLALILRTEYNGKHSGQVALPGGKYESTDGSLWETAVREVEEEIGVASSDVTFIKELSSLYIPISKFKVFPFLAKAKKELSFILQESEVKDIIEMPLDFFLFNSEIQFININTSSNNIIEVPAFVFDNHVIWGATAMMLNELKILFVDSVDL